jgi:hypothetical protein
MRGLGTGGEDGKGRRGGGGGGGVKGGGVSGLLMGRV